MKLDIDVQLSRDMKVLVVEEAKSFGAHHVIIDRYVFVHECLSVLPVQGCTTSTCTSNFQCNCNRSFNVTSTSAGSRLRMMSPMRRVQIYIFEVRPVKHRNERELRR